MSNTNQTINPDNAETRGVLTIFCCGTASGESYVNTYAVPYLYEICASERKAIFNGPGGGPIKFRTNRLRRVFGARSATGIKAKAPGARAPGFGAKVAGIPRNVAGTVNQIRGTGTRDNVKAALAWLKEEKEASAYHTINLIGWSRGAVTCTMLAHKIQENLEDLGNPNVHIFAFDPVAGVKSRGDGMGLWNEFKGKGDARPTKLAGCVKAYRAILHENIDGQMGVRSKDAMFVCSIPKREDGLPDQTGACADYKLIPMPGNHQDSCMRPNAAGPKRKPMSTLGMRLAVDFLTQHGTRFPPIPEIANASKIELYSTILDHYVSEISRGPTHYRGLKITNTMRAHPFYINEDHRQLIARDAQLATCIDTLVQAGPVPQQELVRIRRFLEARQHMYPFTVAYLMIMYLIDLEALAEDAAQAA